MLLAILLAASPPLFVDPALSAALGRMDPKPGAWAEYLVRSTGNGNLRLRVTALAASGEGKYWLELATAAESGMASAARLLLRGTDVSPAAIERAYVMVIGQQPIEIPPEQIGRAPAAGEARAQVTKLGKKRVRVPAGEFSADAFKLADARVWRAASVPLWGLVKAASPRQSVELVASGSSGGTTVFPPGWDQGNGSESQK